MWEYREVCLSAAILPSESFKHVDSCDGDNVPIAAIISSAETNNTLAESTRFGEHKQYISFVIALFRGLTRFYTFQIGGSEACLPSLNALIAVMWSVVELFFMLAPVWNIGRCQFLGRNVKRHGHRTKILQNDENIEHLQILLLLLFLEIYLLLRLVVFRLLIFTFSLSPKS